MSDSEAEQFVDAPEGSKTTDTKKSSSDPKARNTRTNAALLMQHELLADLQDTLDALTNEQNASKSWLSTQREAANSELEDATKYNKLIMNSTKLSESDIENYLKNKTFKRIKDIYWNIIATISEKLEKFESSSGSFSGSQPSNDSDLRLPRLELPTFSGKYEEWLPFNNLFTSSVHKKTNLEPVQKLHYLMKSVTGDAYNQIKNLSLTNENYQKARDILEEQFDHKRKIAHTYMKKMLEQQPLQNENANDLRDFISTVKDCMISLENLGLPVDKWDYVLLYNLQSKIPQTTNMKWEEELGASRDIPKFNKFLEFLESRFRTLEMIEIPPTESKPHQKAFHTQSTANSSTSTVKKTQSTTERQDFRKECGICGKEHATARCKTFLNNTPENRRELAEIHKLCFNCLGSSHSISVCYSTKACSYCQQQHHTLLHLQAPQINTSTVHPATSNVREHVLDSQSRRVTSHNFLASSSNTVSLLGTALVNIITDSGNSVTVRALLDSGADDNYIVNSSVCSVGLEKVLAPFEVAGLNNASVGTVDFKVNLRIQSLNGSFQYNTTAAVVDNITSKIPTHEINSENFNFLRNLPLADPHFNQPGHVQLLLGTGFLAKAKLEGIKKFKDLMAEKTTLGWVITGQSTVSPQGRLFLTQKHHQDFSRMTSACSSQAESSTDSPTKLAGELSNERGVSRSDISGQWSLLLMLLHLFLANSTNKKPRKRFTQSRKPQSFAEIHRIPNFGRKTCSSHLSSRNYFTFRSFFGFFNIWNWFQILLLRKKS